MKIKISHYRTALASIALISASYMVSAKPIGSDTQKNAIINSKMAESARLATLFTKSRAGDAESQYQLATTLLQYGQLSEDANGVAQWFLKAAKQGHTAAATWILATVVDPGDLSFSKELFTEMKAFANGYIMALNKHVSANALQNTSR